MKRRRNAKLTGTELMHGTETASSTPRARLAVFVEAEPFQRAIMALIVLNAVTLGLETSNSIMARWGTALEALDSVILAIFVCELLLRIVAHGPRFFAKGWNIFDFLVVGIALLPSSGALSVLRSLRILRAFRLISAVPAMRSVIEALVKSLPGLSSIIVLLMLIFYVFAVMATKLFGATSEERFGSLGASMYSLFQVMTLEGWPDIVGDVLEHHSGGLFFFIPFMLLSTFTVLNLFIALIVDSMQKLHKIEDDAAHAAELQVEAADRAKIGRELDELTAEIRALRAAVERLQRPPGQE
jgi:voltage-gated sodium channel